MSYSSVFVVCVVIIGITSVYTGAVLVHVMFYVFSHHVGK